MNQWLQLAPSAKFFQEIFDWKKSRNANQIWINQNSISAVTGCHTQLSLFWTWSKGKADGTSNCKLHPTSRGVPPHTSTYQVNQNSVLSLHHAKLTVFSGSNNSILLWRRTTTQKHKINQNSTPSLRLLAVTYLPKFSRPVLKVS